MIKVEKIRIGVKMKINKHQIEAMINLEYNERYLHFISTIVDWKNVYMITYQDNLQVFPAIEYAQLFAETKQIDMKKIFQKTLSDFIAYITRNDININVFPTLLDEICLTNNKKLIHDIEEEFEKY